MLLPVFLGSLWPRVTFQGSSLWQVLQRTGRKQFHNNVIWWNNEIISFQDEYSSGTTYTFFAFFIFLPLFHHFLWKKREIEFIILPQNRWAIHHFTSTSMRNSSFQPNINEIFIILPQYQWQIHHFIQVQCDFGTSREANTFNWQEDGAWRLDEPDRSSLEAEISWDQLRSGKRPWPNQLSELQNTGTAKARKRKILSVLTCTQNPICTVHLTYTMHVSLLHPLICIFVFCFTAEVRHRKSIPDSSTHALKLYVMNKTRAHTIYSRPLGLHGHCLINALIICSLHENTHSFQQDCVWLPHTNRTQNKWKDAGRVPDAICQAWWGEQDCLGLLWCR